MFKLQLKQKLNKMKQTGINLDASNSTLFFVLLFIFIPCLLRAQPTQGFFLDDWQPKQLDIPEYINSNKPDSEANVTITVNFSDTLARVSPYVFGNNANTYSTIMWNNSELVSHIKDLNPHVLRYPGGNLSNEFFWHLEPGNRPDDVPADMNVWRGMDPATWTMSVDNYYKFLETVNSTGIICVNYSYARYGLSEDPVAKAAHYAADWVRYDNGRTKFWEIGNENYGNWQQGYVIDTALNKDGQPEKINGELYGRHCRVFIDSMKAAAAEIGHTIYVGVQAWEDETSWDPVQTVWNELMMPVIADKADFYIVHNYYTPYNEDSDAETILNTWKKSNHFKSSVIKDLEEAGFGPAPLALTEWNIFAVGSKQQVSHINGIHAVLVTGQLIKDQYGLAARWNLANDWNNGDDHGMFSQGNEPGVQRFEPRPVFYYLTFMQRYFGDVMLNSSVAGNDDIVAFASAFENGPAGIVVVNKGTESEIVEIETNNFTPGERFYWYSLTGGELEGEFSRRVAINDQTTNLVAGGPSNYNDISAWAAETEGGITLEAEPWSVNYLILEGFKTNVAETKHSTENVFEIYPNYPNPFYNNTTISYRLKKPAQVKVGIYNINGQLVKRIEDDKKTTGFYQLKWNGKNEKGNIVPGGIYFYRFEFITQVGFYSETKNMSFIR